LTRRSLLLAGLGTFAAGASASPATVTPFSCHFDHVLGTSLDISGSAASGGAALAAERVALDEIERLRAVFSPFDPDSELGRFNRSAGPVAVSDDFAAVLRQYERWRPLTAGACNPRVAALARIWADAARAGSPPDDAELRRVAREIAGPGWHLDGDRAVRVSGATLDLSSIAKGYILGRAAAAMREKVPGVSSLLVSLGGDLCGWGTPPGGWLVDVQDPARPEDNADPLTALRLRDGAVATSGGYQRYHDIAGRRYSHLIDPRTGRPAGHVASATALAPDSVTANALATALCVLRPEEGLRLASSLPGVGCLLVLRDGRQLRGGVFTAAEVAKEEKKDEKPGAWPTGHQVSFALTIPKPTTGRKIRRPYVAIWIENEDGKPVRTVTVWGNSPRWLPTMSGWWKVAGGARMNIRAVTRATRAPGKYTVVWDGKGDDKKPLPQGTYTVKVEVHREHGKHVFQEGKIECRGEEATLTLEANAEAGETVVTFGKKKK
jgi:thiamine biosynthesis lipoprotein ApbE